jgi:hypothetical protein
MFHIAHSTQQDPLSGDSDPMRNVALSAINRVCQLPSTIYAGATMCNSRCIDAEMGAVSLNRPLAEKMGTASSGPRFLMNV